MLDLEAIAKAVATGSLADYVEEYNHKNEAEVDISAPGETSTNTMEIYVDGGHVHGSFTITIAKD